MLLLLFASALAAQAAAGPSASAVYTVKEIASYHLAAPVFERFDRASRLIATATRADPRLAENPPFTRDVSVLDDVVVAAAALDQRLSSEPAFASALHTAKITSREYTTFALALFAARLAHGFVKSGAMRFVPEGVAKENVAFIESHEPAIAAVLQALGVEDP